VRIRKIPGYKILKKATKEPYVSGKETWVSAKEPCISALRELRLTGIRRSAVLEVPCE